MCLLAVFLLLGGFGAGGKLPVSLFHGAYWLFGWAAYLTSVALVYWAIHKFNSEDRRIPLAKLVSMTLLLFCGLFCSGGNRQPSGRWPWLGQ